MPARRHERLPLLLLWLVAQTPVSAELAPGPWRDASLPPAQRAGMLLAKMNQSEKLGFLHGGCKGYVFNSCGVPRLGVPNMMANDGPQGFRGKAGTSTAWPAGLAIAATFDVDSSSAWGEGQGQEFYDKGANVQLGPGLCLLRAPLNGRAFEYMSGEVSDSTSIPVFGAASQLTSCVARTHAGSVPRQHDGSARSARHPGQGGCSQRQALRGQLPGKQSRGCVRQHRRADAVGDVSAYRHPSPHMLSA